MQEKQVSFRCDIPESTRNKFKAAVALNNASMAGVIVALMESYAAQNNQSFSLGPK